MSGPVLVYLPDELMLRLNRRVAENKTTIERRKLTKAERMKADSIASRKGQPAAKRYIEELNRPDKRRASRVRLIAELIEVGLKHTK